MILPLPEICLRLVPPQEVHKVGPYQFITRGYSSTCMGETTPVTHLLSAIYKDYLHL